MTSTELTIIGLLVAIASQTTYTTYRSLKGATGSRNYTSIYVDTSVLMDGRVVSIAQTGFIPGVLIIPRSVIGEMQFLADNADSEKRERARRGLDVAHELQAMEGVDVELLQDGSKAEEGVDERLLSLAKESGGMLMTIDFNLNKVAQVEGIRVLNVNDLARQLRMVYLPGDTLELELTGHGSDKHQAVGHLDDGTMVVVEQSRAAVGQTVTIEVIRSLQTAAGRMMFAKRVDTKNDKHTGAHQTLPNNQRVVRGEKKPAHVAASTPAKRNQKSASQKPKQVVHKADKPSAPPRANNAKNGNSRRPKTSAQREASLLRLVDEQ